MPGLYDPPQTRTVLVIGDANRGEMKSLFKWIQGQIGSDDRLVFVGEISKLDEKLPSDCIPDLIVVLQSWPDQFSPSDVDQLFAFAPVARVVVGYGALCESDGRNREIWPLSVRVPVWAAQRRVEFEWRLVQGQAGSQAPIPRSASREEIFAADHDSLESTTVPKLILVDSPDPSFKQFVIEFLKLTGHLVVDDNPDLILFDADPWGSVRMEALRLLREAYPNAPVVGLMNLVQPEIVDELIQLGITDVRPKLGTDYSRVRFDKSERFFQ